MSQRKIPVDEFTLEAGRQLIEAVKAELESGEGQHEYPIPAGHRLGIKSFDPREVLTGTYTNATYVAGESTEVDINTPWFFATKLVIDPDHRLIAVDDTINTWRAFDPNEKDTYRLFTEQEILSKNLA